MILRTLILRNFRSYSHTKYAFSPHITIILGPNTAGKTNILEALFLSATGKSFRAETDRDMIRWDAEIGRVRVIVERFDQEKTELETVLTVGEVAGQKAPIKQYLVNGVPRRLVDFVGNLRVVLFWPEDLELVTDSPSIRRRYLDFVLVQVNREYRRSLASYEKGVRQRNRVLEKIREGEAGRGQLMFWDQLVIKTGQYITTTREKFIASINGANKPFGDYCLEYDASFISEARLAQYTDAEVASATTLVGPHRDDISFLEKKRNLAKFGSRGEQRLAILWLKLAELEYVTLESGERPVLLLDDIFSELDHMHRDEVIRIMGLQQTILTTTDRHFLPQRLAKEAEMIELK